MKIISLFQRLIPKKIWQQIFLVLLFLVVIPLVITGLFLIKTSQEALQKTIEADLRQITSHATGEVVKDYQGMVETLSTAASILGTLQADSWKQETTIVELALRYPVFRQICSLNINGQEIACSNLGALLNKNVDDPIYTCAKNNKTCVSDVRIASDHTPVLDVAVPVHYSGKVTGVLKAEYSLRGIWSVVDQIDFDHQSQVFLIDSKGQIIASKDKKQVLQNLTLPFSKALKVLADGKTGSHIETGSDGQPWVVAFAPIPSLGWALCIAQPTKEAFAFVEIMRNQSWLLVLLSLLAAGLIALLLANRMSRPIEQLMEATKHLARGETDVLLPVRRKDEMGRLMFAFNSMTQQLKKARHSEKLSIVGRSAAAIAHELKNSLTLVKTFVQLLPERHHEKAFVKESTETILKELETWNGMLKNMMDFAKDPLPLKKSFIQVYSLIDDVTVLARFKAESQGIRFLVDVPNSLPALDIDKERVKQVLVNILNNAFEAVNPKGTIAITGFHHLVEEHSYIEIKISNSGPGIPQEHLDKIFTPFFTTKESGLGLGLSISREIIHRHGGRLEVKSQKDQGTVFILQLPVYSQISQERTSYDFVKNISH